MSVSKNRLSNPSFALVDPAMPLAGFTDNVAAQTAVGWFIQSFKNAGTAIALAVSRVAFVAGQTSLPGEPQQYLRLAFTTAGTSLGLTSFLKLFTRVAASVLNGSYATFSFWMSSDVANRPVILVVRRNYGTGGSPSPDDIFLFQNPVLFLVSGWQRYALTFVIPPPAPASVFGSGNNAFIEVALYFQAGANVAIPGAPLASPAANIILFAQPQLQAGTKATDWVDGDAVYKTLSGVPVSGTKAIGNAVSSVTVTGLGLSFIPSQVLVTVRKLAADTLVLTAAVRSDSVTAGGFTVDLSAATDSATYQLDYDLIP